VLSDFVQLLPDRRVTVTATDAANRFAVRVDGLAYRSTSWPTPPTEDDLGPDAFMITGLEPPPPLVEVGVEQRLPGTSDEAGWRPASAEQPFAVEVDAAVSATGQTDPTAPLWQGTVTVPPDREPGQFRIVVREREQLLDDSLHTFTYRERLDPGELPPGHKGPPFVTITDTYPPGAGRLTFAETIEV
jgi:hypothetical protein